MTNLAVWEVFFTLPHMPDLSDPPDPPNSPEFPDSSASPDPSNSPFTRSTISNRFIQITGITGIQQLLNNYSSCSVSDMITTLGGLKVYNDFDDVTMAHEDDTQLCTGETDKIILTSSSLKTTFKQKSESQDEQTIEKTE